MSNDALQRDPATAVPIWAQPAALPLADVLAAATVDGALTAGKHNPVDATSGNRAMTLANAAGAGLLTSFEKTDATANTVTLTLNLRGTVGGTLTLVWLREAIVLVSKADGSWWPVAGHKTKSALDAVYAALASPALTGVPTAPTAAPGTNTTQISTCAFVQAAIAALVASSPATLDTLNELATALGDDPNFATTMTTALAGKLSVSILQALSTGLLKVTTGTGALSVAVAADIPLAAVGGTGPMPAATRLDQVTAPGADLALAAHKVTGMANGSASTDGAAFGQIAAALAALLGGPSPAWPAGGAVTAYTLYQLPTGGLGYVTAGRTAGATFDATERAAWIFIPGRHYEKITSGVSWTCPSGVTRARFRLRGGGAGGGGGGSAATGIAQIGGAGGGAGAGLDVDLAVTAATAYTLAIGAGGVGGSAGAAGGNPGGNGGNGGDTTIIVPVAGTTYTARGGGRGLASGAGATTAVSGGHYGNAGGGSTVAGVPGQGGASAAIAIGFDNVSGGAGAGTCTTTLGGVGGNARTAPGAQAAAPSGNSGTSSGTAGTSATEPGCGGGGGGGGTNNTGAGAAGGAGVAGQIEVWF